MIWFDRIRIFLGFDTEEKIYDIKINGKQIYTTGYFEGNLGHYQLKCAKFQKRNHDVKIVVNITRPYYQITEIHFYSRGKELEKSIDNKTSSGVRILDNRTGKIVLFMYSRILKNGFTILFKVEKTVVEEDTILLRRE